MSISDKFNEVDTVKSQIKQAIIDKGVEVASTDGFATYPAKIASISGGGASSGCFPSGVYEEITVGASGATYTAPADGWYMVSITKSGSDLAIGDAVFTNISRGDFKESVSTSGSDSFGSFPVLEGDIVSISHYVVYGALTLRFYYTLDSAPQQS